MKSKGWGLVKFSNSRMNREMQILMKELFLVKLEVEPVLSNIFIYCLATE